MVLPWRGEVDLLLASVEEEYLRAAPSFIEVAAAVVRAKQVIEREGNKDKLSDERFAALLAQRGLAFGPERVVQMSYAAQRLSALLPLALGTAMSRAEVERIRALDRAALAVWLEQEVDSRAEYDLVFTALCRRYDGEDWDFGNLRRALETEVAGRLGVSIHGVRMEIDARLRRLRHAELRESADNPPQSVDAKQE